MPGTPTTGGEEMLQTMATILRERGVEGWLVGGTVRDRELHRFSPDLDVAVAGDAASIAADVAAALKAPWFPLSDSHRAFRVMGKEGHVDVAGIRGHGILADLAERDFTVNAMALAVAGGDLIDPFGGLADLRARRLVAVSERIFRDDPLRLMRAPRFSHVLGLQLDPRLAEAVRAQASDVSRAAAERVATEIVLTLMAGRAGDAARLWNDLGLLQAVAPEIRQGEDTARLFAVLDRLEELLADLRGWFPNDWPLLAQRLADPVDGTVKRPVALRLTGLLDPSTRREAETAGRRLKLSGAMLSLLASWARMTHSGHGGPGSPGTIPTHVRASQEESGGRPLGPGREAILFLWEAAPWEPEVILLAAATGAAEMAGHGAVAELPAASLDRARALMAAWRERAASGVRRLPFDGFALMRELELQPGPQLGRALRAARLAWEAGEAETADEALAAARDALGEE